MTKYRKKPVEIEAMQFLTGEGTTAAMEPVLWIERNGGEYRIDPADGWLYIRTLEGEMHVRNGDWIIRGVQGEFYPCKPDIFAATYEKVQESEEASEYKSTAGPRWSFKVGDTVRSWYRRDVTGQVARIYRDKRGVGRWKVELKGATTGRESDYAADFEVLR